MEIIVCPQTFYFVLWRSAERARSARASAQREKNYFLVYPPPTRLRARSLIFRGFYFRSCTRRSFEKIEGLWTDQGNNLALPVLFSYYRNFSSNENITPKLPAHRLTLTRSFSLLNSFFSCRHLKFFKIARRPFMNMVMQSPKRGRATGTFRGRSCTLIPSKNTPV